MSSPAVNDAARVVPPGPGSLHEAALAAATPSGELDLFADVGDDVMWLWVSLVCTAAFNFTVGETGLAAPTSVDFFAAQTPQQFRVNRANRRFMRVIMNAGGSYKWWVSGL